MKKQVLALLMCVLMMLNFVGCSGVTETEQPSIDASATEAVSESSTEAVAEASDAEVAAEVTATEAVAEPEEENYVEDGTFRYLYSSEIGTMNYLATSTTADYKSSANFVDTLIEYDSYGVVKPDLATEWSVSEDGLVWTFKLREGVKWYTSELEEYADVTANDFVYAIQWILTPANESSNVDHVASVIKNAREYFDGSITDFTQVGVKAIDDYTLEYTLFRPCPYFLSMMSYVAFMPANQQFVEENAELFGTSNDTLLYNGAYYCTSWEPQSEFIWERNPNYWDVENVYIKTISGRYNAEAEALAPEMYLRGEIDEAQIPVEILDSWMADEETKDIVRPNRATYDAMWWFFDFDPHFDEQFDNENFKLAVNNTAWRLSIVYGLDRVKAMTVYDPYDPDQYLMNTITPPNFVAIDGKDFTVTGDLAAVTNQDWFQSDKALEYKEQAIAELTEAGATFPVVFPYYYRVDQANQDLVSQIVEQQLEGLLGTDYIDIVPMAGPAENYLSEVRKAGKYGLMEEGWGPDFADPSTYAAPWGLSWSYNNRSMNTQEEYLTGYTYTQEDYDNGVIDDPAYVGTAQQIYDKMIQEAQAETIDLAKRYELYAKAEAWLINEGIVIPFRVFSSGYVASKITVFDGEYSSFGVSTWRYKGKHLLQEAMSLEEFQAQFEQWKIDRDAALAAAE